MGKENSVRLILSELQTFQNSHNTDTDGFEMFVEYGTSGRWRPDGDGLHLVLKMYKKIHI